MKGILLIIDGLGDLPNKLLEDKTPLEAANTPNMDFFAARGEMGSMYPVKLGFVPESDEALLSIFGNVSCGNCRGQFEAIGAGLKMTRGDLALRVNFATIDSLKSGKIVDRRVGRTLSSEEIELLSKSLNKINLPVKFEFVPTIQHRAVLVFRGGMSEGVSGNDSTYSVGRVNFQEMIKACSPNDDEENSHYTANVLNEFIEKAYLALKDHPVNLNRIKRGLMPANYLLLRSAGVDIPKLNDYRKWCSMCYMPLEIGFSIASGMKTLSFEYPKLKGIDAYENLFEGLDKACKFAVKVIKKQKNNFDYCYVHLRETDFPGHDNKPVEKKIMLEEIDKKFFKFLRNFAPPNKIKVAVTGDHSTPCKLKTHSADPVPVLLYNFQIPKERHFNEAEARKGSLGKFEGKDFLEKIGFDE